MSEHKDTSLSRKYLGEFVYGAIDGTVTTFAIISGALGAALSPAIVIIFGFANLFADGFSMAISNYLSTKSDRQIAETNSQVEKPPMVTASVTFVSFIVVGFIPVFPFVLATWFPSLSSIDFLLSGVSTGVAFFLIGTLKSFVAHKGVLRGGIETLLIGGVAAVIAFGVGFLLRGMAP